MAICETRQLRARQRRSDKVPVSIGEKAGGEQVFAHMHCEMPAKPKCAIQSCINCC